MIAGKVIFGLLSNDDEVKSKLGDKIFPVMIPEKTGYPALVYKFPDMTPTFVKDRLSPLDIVSCNLELYITDYRVGSELMEHIRTILDGQSGEIYGVNLDSMRITDEGDGEMIEGYQFIVFTQAYELRIKK